MGKQVRITAPSRRTIRTKNAKYVDAGVSSGDYDSSPGAFLDFALRGNLLFARITREIYTQFCRQRAGGIDAKGGEEKNRKSQFIFAHSKQVWELIYPR